MKRFILVAISVSLLFQHIQSQSVSPKREFRGAWIATVTNLDWPSNPNFTPAMQRSTLIDLLDGLQSVGINAVIFQIRPECDALYNSPYEPWSYWLTGKQGQAPSDNYDPLIFAIDEAHKRGMELHAWFNPYRAVKTTGSYTVSSSHVSVTHPDWILSFPSASLKMLNPGLPQVRDYDVQVIADVVTRYNVDGIHMDDYFYPYTPKISTEDTVTFRLYPRGITNIDDWRRDNVNILIKRIYDTVQVLKPWVKFGMSPFGIWKSGTPSGISGLNAYSDIFCDALSWLQGKYIDYITPQLYWPFGGGQDYAKLQPWWSSQLNGRHFYPGLATYQAGSSWGPITVIGNQIKLGRTLNNAQGTIQFRARNVVGNGDFLRTDPFFYPAVIPVMPWKETIPPNAPNTLRIESVPSSKLFALRWNSPAPASDGDTAMRYIVYRFSSSSPSASDRENALTMIAFSGPTYVIPLTRIDTAGIQYYFAVSALDKNNNESTTLSNIVSQPSFVSTPLLAFPDDGSPMAQSGMAMRWNKADSAVMYGIQVSTDPSFARDSIVRSLTLVDTSYYVSGLITQKKYFWHVAAGNQGGVSLYSPMRSFVTAWPVPPTQIYPVFIVGTSLMPTYSWTKAGGTTFRLQVASAPDFITGIMVLDTTITDSVCTQPKPLDPERYYQWRVMATNAYGSSDWSPNARFKTWNPAIVKADGTPLQFYELSQNYPNPFNPATTIHFVLLQREYTTLKIYDVLGREVSTLIAGELAAGGYSVQFEVSNLPSGVYFYRLQSGSFVATKKMVFQK